MKKVNFLIYLAPILFIKSLLAGTCNIQYGYGPPAPHCTDPAMMFDPSCMAGGTMVPIGGTCNDGVTPCTSDFECTPTDTPPSVSGVGFAGNLKVGEQLTATYNYYDAQSDSENGSTFQWYTSINTSGGNKTAISGATLKTYTLKTSELGKYISFKVTPKNVNATGTSVESSINSTAVVSNADNDSLLSIADGVDENTMISLASTANELSKKLDVFDFKITDLGTSDSYSTDITNITFTLGNTNFILASKITWVLNGPNISNKITSAVNGIISFGTLSSSITNNTSETFTLSAYFNDPTSLTDNEQIQLSISNSNITTNSNSSSLAIAQSITNNNNLKVDIKASKLIFLVNPSKLGASK